jgi:hypothetical protein
MENILVSFDTAKLAKEKGFPQFTKGICLGHYDIYPNGTIEFNGCSEAATECIDAPTQSLLQKWFRDVHGIDLWFGMLNEPNKYHVEDIIKGDIIIGGINIGSKTYEEALELGLQEALKLI